MAITPRVSSQLINDYQELQAYSSDILKAVFRNEAGDLEFITYSPQDSTLYNILPDADSDDGWDRVAIGGEITLVDPQSKDHYGAFGSVTACCVAGTAHLVAVVDNGRTLIACSRDSDSSAWGKWNPNDLVDITSPPLPTPTDSVLFVALVAHAESLWLMVSPLIGDSSLRPLYTGRFLGSDDLGILQRSDTSIYPSGSLVSVDSEKWGSGVVYVSPAANNLSQLKFLAAPYSGQPVEIGEPTGVWDLTTARAADGYTRMFFRTPGDGSADSLVMVDFSSSSPAPELISRFGSWKFMQAVDANQGAVDGSIHLYLADDGWNLWVTRPKPDAEGWEEPIPLGLPVIDLFAGVGEDGQGELILETNNEIIRLWNNPEVASMDDPGYLQVEPILMVSQELAVTPSYITKVTLIDDSGDLVRDHAVLLSAGTVTSVSVNHRRYTLSPDRPVSLTSDGAGAISLYSQTSGLDVAKLRVADDAGLDQWIVRNDQPIQALRKVDLASFEAVFPAAHAANAKPTLEGIQQFLALLPESGSADRAYDALTNGPMPHEHWQFSAVDEAVSFTPLTQEQARLFLDGLPSGENVRILGGGFWEGLGDLLHSAEKEVEKTLQFVVSTLSDGLSVAVTLVIGGITYVFNAIVSVAHEIMGLIDALWSLAMAGLVKLVGLLGWNPIEFIENTWATKQFLEKSMLSTFGTIRDWVKQNGSQLPDDPAYQPARFQANLDAVNDAVKDRTFGNPLNEASGLSAAQGTAAQGMADAIHAQEVVLEWLLHKITGPLATFRLDLDLSSLVQFSALQKDLVAIQANMQELHVNSAIQSKIDGLSKTLEGFSSRSAIEGVELAGFLGNLQPLIKELIAEVPTLAAPLISMMENFLDGLLDNDLLTTPLSNCHFLQKISDLFNPGESEPLTFIGLGALVSAVPATAYFQLEYGRAPFAPADWERAKDAENPLLHLRQQTQLSGGFDVTLVFAVFVAVLSAIWVVVDLGINAAGLIWAANPVKLMAFAAVMIPVSILTFLAIDLGMTSTDLPADLVGILWTELVLLALPFITWLIFAALAPLFPEIIPALLVLLPIVATIIGALQIPFAITAIALEYKHQLGSFLKVLLHLGTPTANLVQAAGFIPLVPAFILIYDIFVDLLNLDGAIVWSITSASAEG